MRNFSIGSNYPYTKEQMCAGLSTNSGHCTITCPLAVETAIKELNPDDDPEEGPYYYYISGLPTRGVTFTWVRPTASK